MDSRQKQLTYLLKAKCYLQCFFLSARIEWTVFTTLCSINLGLCSFKESTRKATEYHTIQFSLKLDAFFFQLLSDFFNLPSLLY